MKVIHPTQAEVDQARGGPAPELPVPGWVAAWAQELAALPEAVRAGRIAAALVDIQATAHDECVVVVEQLRRSVDGVVPGDHIRREALGAALQAIRAKGGRHG